LIEQAIEQPEAIGDGDESVRGNVALDRITPPRKNFEPENPSVIEGHDRLKEGLHVTAGKRGQKIAREKLISVHSCASFSPAQAP
jgi:hypothetical protein